MTSKNRGRHVHAKLDRFVGSLAVDQRTGMASLSAGLSCQNDFQDSLDQLERELPKNQNRIALGGLVKAADRYVLTVNRFGHVYVSEEEFAQLMLGKAVKGMDQNEKEGGFHRVIKQLIESDTSLVLWSHPMMQKKMDRLGNATMRFAHALAPSLSGN